MDHGDAPAATDTDILTIKAHIEQLFVYKYCLVTFLLNGYIFTLIKP